MKKTILVITILSVIGIVGFNLYQKNQKKQYQLSQLLSTNNEILNISAKDIFTVQSAEFIKELPITGILKPINEAVIKSKVNGDISNLTVKVGYPITKNQTLAIIKNSDTDSKLQQSIAQIIVAQKQLSLAKNQFNRNEELAQQNFISKNSLDKFKTDLEIAQANLNSAISAHNINKKSQSDMVIKAPFAGIVSQKNVENGEKISPDGILLKIVDISKLELEAGLSGENISKIKLNQDVALNLGQQQILGRINRIAPISLNNSRLINIYITLDNPNYAIKAGIYGKGSIILSKENATIIPNTAITKKLDNSLYINIIENSKIKSIPIKIEDFNNEYSKVNLPINTRIINIPINNITQQTKLVIQQ